MKNIFKYLLVAIIAVSFTTSCTDSDLIIDDLYDSVDSSGAVLRILSYPDDIVNVTGGGFNNIVQFQFEVQEGDGSFTPTFTEVRVYVQTYNDQDFELPTLDENGNEFGENLFLTISKEEFSTLSDINGLPQYYLDMPTSDIIATQPGAIYAVPSFIHFRFELQMEDGRVWSVDNAGTTLGGPYFESPFQHTTIFLNF